MPPREASQVEASPNTVSSDISSDGVKKETWKLWSFLSLIGLDGVFSLIILTPFIPYIRQYQGSYFGHFTLHASLIDLQILSALRLLSAVLALIGSYHSNNVPPESPFELYHQNGDRKTREELENEALEESCCPWLRRYVRRPAFSCEVLSIVTGLWSTAKCLARLNYEVGTMADKLPMHPIFWLALAFVTLFCSLESAYLDSICKVAGEYGRFRRQSSGQTTSWMRRIGSNLSIPLLSASAPQESQDEAAADVEEGSSQQSPAIDPEDVRGVSDISSDPSYRATMEDLLSICYPDMFLIILAVVFLLLAAVAQVYIPKFTGNILDALTSTFADNSNGKNDESIWDIPGFVTNVERLVVASILGGVFSGARGSIFTVIGGRANVRLRVQLMDSLLSQDIGFYDTTKTGDITSRLSSDTTLVGDQVTLNVNVFLRSLVQAVGVLIFMFVVSWQLSLLAFVSVPVITVLSKWYGMYVRSLTKLMQKKLADGNSVSEAALGSMSTVRAFDAGESELREFESAMEKYLSLNYRSAVAYWGYSGSVTSLPQLVTALVLYYGGLLVRNGDMTSGQLVSFLLYLTSLSDAFGSIGYIFSSLTQAAGAADKVFELIQRKPKMKPPSVNATVDRESLPSRGILGIYAMKTASHRASGTRPGDCRGEVTLKDVEMYYPARPQRRVLNGINLNIPSGSVVALVGASGGGKSSVMSLVQHLYDPSSGQVLIDGNEVRNLCPQWLSRHVSVVSQEPTLFGRSIKRNIMYGLEGTEYEPTEEEIKEAARLANASEFIEKLPFGYDSEVGERGVQLSGGQKQRIAIARALVRKPRILLLDEATSALDAESEALVQEAIDSMIARGRGTSNGNPGMTVIIVAHRLSTVRNADIIFVISEGKVVEQGNHDSLVAKPDGAYSALIARQMKAQQKLENSK